MSTESRSAIVNAPMRLAIPAGLRALATQLRSSPNSSVATALHLTRLALAAGAAATPLWAPQPQSLMAAPFKHYERRWSCLRRSWSGMKATSQALQRYARVGACVNCFLSHHRARHYAALWTSVAPASTADHLLPCIKTAPHTAMAQRLAVGGRELRLSRRRSQGVIAHWPTW